MFSRPTGRVVPTRQPRPEPSPRPRRVLPAPMFRERRALWAVPGESYSAGTRVLMVVRTSHSVGNNGNHHAMAFGNSLSRLCFDAPRTTAPRPPSKRPTSGQTARRVKTADCFFERRRDDGKRRQKHAWLAETRARARSCITQVTRSRKSNVSLLRRSCAAAHVALPSVVVNVFGVSADLISSLPRGILSARATHLTVYRPADSSNIFNGRFNGLLRICHPRWMARSRRCAKLTDVEGEENTIYFHVPLP